MELIKELQIRIGSILKKIVVNCILIIVVGLILDIAFPGYKILVFVVMPTSILMISMMIFGNHILCLTEKIRKEMAPPDLLSDEGEVDNVKEICEEEVDNVKEINKSLATYTSKGTPIFKLENVKWSFGMPMLILTRVDVSRETSREETKECEKGIKKLMVELGVPVRIRFS